MTTQNQVALSQTGNVMVETSGQLVEPIPSSLEDAERTRTDGRMNDQGVGTQINGKNGDDHEELNSKAGRLVKKRKSSEGGGTKASVPTYKIYKKGEFG